MWTEVMEHIFPLFSLLVLLPVSDAVTQQKRGGGRQILYASCMLCIYIGSCVHSWSFCQLLCIPRFARCCLCVSAPHKTKFDGKTGCCGGEEASLPCARWLCVALTEKLGTTKQQMDSQYSIINGPLIRKKCFPSRCDTSGETALWKDGHVHYLILAVKL